MGRRAGEPDPRICVVCGDGRIVLDDVLGEHYCKDCGLVIEDGAVDFSDISFTFDKDSSSSHSMTSFTKVNKGLGTVPDRRSAFFAGMDNKNLLREPMEKEERSFSMALHCLRLVWNGMSLPEDLRIGSAILYRKCIKKGITNGRKGEAMALAVALMKCEEAGIIRDKDRLITAFELRSNEVTSCIRAVREEFGVVEEHQRLRALLSEGLVKVKASEELKDRASKMMEAVILRKLYTRKKPKVVTAKVLYDAARSMNVMVSRIKVAKSLGISERSLRRSLKV